MGHFIKAFIAVVAVFFFTNAFAAPSAKVLFWYPGESGTSADAQPILDEFLEIISTKAAPDKFSGLYLNDVSGGISYIAKEKPVIAVISFAAWHQNKNKIGGNVLLSTVTEPAGKSFEVYSLVGPADKIPSGATILTSEPLSLTFVSENLFPDLDNGARLTQSHQMLMELRNIGEGKSKNFAILTPSEAYTLSKVSFPWAKNLKTVSTSKQVPSARVVLLDNNWPGSQKFKQALLNFGRTEDEKTILKELRLVGFAEK